MVICGYGRVLFAGVTVGDVKTGWVWLSPRQVVSELVGEWVRFDENGPLVQPLNKTTAATLIGSNHCVQRSRIVFFIKYLPVVFEGSG